MTTTTKKPTKLARSEVERLAKMLHDEREQAVLIVIGVSIRDWENLSGESKTMNRIFARRLLQRGVTLPKKARNK